MYSNLVYHPHRASVHVTAQYSQGKGCPVLGHEKEKMALLSPSSDGLPAPRMFSMKRGTLGHKGGTGGVEAGRHPPGRPYCPRRGNHTGRSFGEGDRC